MSKSSSALHFAYISKQVFLTDCYLRVTNTMTHSSEQKSQGPVSLWFQNKAHYICLREMFWGFCRWDRPEPVQSISSPYMITLILQEPVATSCTNRVTLTIPTFYAESALTSFKRSQNKWRLFTYTLLTGRFL